MTILAALYAAPIADIERVRRRIKRHSFGATANRQPKVRRIVQQPIMVSDVDGRTIELPCETLTKKRKRKLRRKNAAT